MSTFNTIHIFGYGETQIITEKTNNKMLTTDLTKVEALVDEIFSKKPSDITCSKDYHAITVLNNHFIQFIPKDENEKGFNVKIEEISESFISDLVEEFNALIPAN